METEAFARDTDPDTSHEAAASFDPTEMERIVYDTIARFPKGATQDDLERALPHIKLMSITPRIKPLRKKGLVFDTGEKRRGRSGRNQRVYAVTPPLHIIPIEEDET